VDKKRSAAVEDRIRRRANRHGHWRVYYPCGCVREVCRDFGAHQRDVADMIMLLQMVGFLPDPESVPREPHKGIRTLGDKHWRSP
jgi:hypothetical protein